ncbi:hypothetical protein LTR37_018862 [Vermiconidia calcicola]|uniref:Uncharacterized protein n=1 Tax=Vermiconidia calcicola TaxID=1690605 RepID=A0ACC3MIS6_9PEZI|nr:hypothetical protein LTR37_018862 [Vermiconidia calcicola]
MAYPSVNGSPRKPWIMNAFAMMAPGHLAPGLWKHPDQQPQTLDHWVQLAKFLDEAGFHGIFFADVLGNYDIYGGNAPALKSGAQIPIQDVSLFISALAYNTKNLSFGVTASTTYENPYALARKFSTLDQLSNGRIGWNIVTSYLESAAKSYGKEKLLEHDERYRMAREFMEVVYKLLEGSWQDGAIETNRETVVFANPAKINKYYKCAGLNLVGSSPQRTPFLLQAGASKAGQDFATTHAEAMFLPGMVPAKTGEIVRSMKNLLVKKGRSRDSVKFIAGIFICVDEMDEKAQAKFQDLMQYADLDGTASLFG